MKFDKFGNRVTKTPEEIKAEKRAKDISEKALKSIHEQQREEVETRLDIIYDLKRKYGNNKKYSRYRKLAWL